MGRGKRRGAERGGFGAERAEGDCWGYLSKWSAGGGLKGMAVANNNIEMEVKVENPETFTWKKVEECIELVF